MPLCCFVKLSKENAISFGCCDLHPKKRIVLNLMHRHLELALLRKGLAQHPLVISRHLAIQGEETGLFQVSSASAFVL